MRFRSRIYRPTWSQPGVASLDAEQPTRLTQHPIESGHRSEQSENSSSSALHSAGRLIAGLTSPCSPALGASSTPPSHGLHAFGRLTVLPPRRFRPDHHKCPIGSMHTVVLAAYPAPIYAQTSQVPSSRESPTLAWLTGKDRVHCSAGLACWQPPAYLWRLGRGYRTAAVPQPYWA